MSTFLRKLAGEKVTIIQGNPKYIEGNPKADEFYAALRTLLEEQGASVYDDPGADFTVPEHEEGVWLGHSRGMGRLPFAPDNVKTLRLDDYQPGGLDDQGEPTDAHYTVTPEMREAILSILSGPSRAPG